MAHSLTRSLIEAHLLEAPASAAWPNGGELVLGVDHVVAGGGAALLTLAAFASLRRPRVAVDLALACADRGGAAVFDDAEALRELKEAALGHGVWFSRPGHGRCDLVHRERFAAPGRLSLVAGRRTPSAGALGALSLMAGPLEAAAALGGAPHLLAWPGLLAVNLRGSLSSWVGGLDVALELLRRLPAGGARRMIVEYGGPGVALLDIAERFTLAALGGVLGACTSVFPSDEVTRTWLQAQGRESDWKRLEVEPRGGSDETLELDLDAVEPMVAEIGRAIAPRLVRQANGARVDQVEIGPEAGISDLVRLARLLEGHRIADGVSLTILPGTRQVLETLGRNGSLRALTDAGARVLEVGAPRGAPPALAREAVGLCFGSDAAERLASGSRWLLAGLQPCAAAALRGRVTDPREIEAASAPAPGPLAAPEGWLLRPPAPGSEPQAGTPPITLPLGRPLDGPLRGTVLIRLGHQVTTEQILPWGARVRPLLGNLAALSEHAFAAVDGDFASRARVLGGGFVVAGRDYGSGVAHLPAALVPMLLGVRALLAVSCAPDYRRLLVQVGVLPLAFAVPEDYEALAQGDELEIPGLPESLEPEKPLVVRNLSQGTQYAVRHDLPPREIALLRAGGLLRDLALEDRP